MNLHAEMTEAADAAARTVGNVQAGQFGDSTPCTEWDVHTLLNHLILWTSYSAERRAHGESVSEELMAKDFAAEPGFAAAYRAQLDRALAAWADPAAWERDLNVMGSATPAADVAALLIAETVLHAWDLAVATGQSYTVGDKAAAAALASVEANAELFRQYKGFAEPVPAPAGAPVLDRVLALSGRDPDWTSGPGAA
jgi:uncharacterized protein (TIGR03086 family)